MKEAYSISELHRMSLEKMPKTARAIQYRADRENWPYIEVPCQGGKNGRRREYMLNIVQN